MAVFLDSGFYLGLIHPKDENYKRCIELLQILKTGEYGQLFTSNYIMAESATLVAVRTRNNAHAIQNAFELFLGSGQLARFLRLNEDNLKDAWDLFQKINLPKSPEIISYIDCSNIILCRSYSIETIISYDSHFDGWIKRIF